MKKIIIFIISIIFIFKSFIINAQENKNNSEKTDQAIADLGLYFPGWYVKKPDEKISKVYLALFNKGRLGSTQEWRIEKPKKHYY
jgi:hypothetical protein